MKRIDHYCQKCLAPNPLGQDFCWRCGTRLMILVEPPGSRYETLETSVSSEEHLLERISALETSLGRLSEKLERSLDLLLRQAQNSYFDRALVKALGGLERGAFERFINEGFLFIEDEQPARGIRSLQRAAEIASNNGPLLSFVGEHFFKTGKTRRAQDYLDRAHELSPEDIRVSLLLGLTCADQGDVERAKDLLNSTTRRGGSSFAAHYGLGRLFVAEENWKKALREFKRALASKPSPEAHYALASLYYQLSRDSLAARHLHRALEMDDRYGEALYVLGLVYQRSGQEGLAKEAFERAGNADLAFAAPLPGKKRQTRSSAAVAPLFQIPASSSRRLISGGDRRLAEALRRDALSTFIAAGLQRR